MEEVSESLCLDKIAFWLFQFPSHFMSPEPNIEKLRKFIVSAELQGKVALELRHPSGCNSEILYKRTRRHVLFRGCAWVAPRDGPNEQLCLPSDFTEEQDGIRMSTLKQSFWISCAESSPSLEKICASQQ